jgi:hypothetical protein
MPEGGSKAVTIVLSAYMSDPNEPVLERHERSFRVALSDHADFVGTLEYVKSTGAKEVVVDNTRGGYAVDLSREIKSLLGINARPSTACVDREWADA